MKVFNSGEFNKGIIVDEINSLVTSFNFETFSIQNFPFPYLNNFILKHSVWMELISLSKHYILIY